MSDEQRKHDKRGVDFPGLATVIVSIGATIITGGACSVLALDGTTGAEAVAMAAIGAFAIVVTVATAAWEWRGRP